MKLYAPYGKLTVTDSDDLIILGSCGDFETVGDSGTLYNKGVVAGGRKSLWHILKKIFSVVTDAGSLSMHQFIGTDNFSAKGLSD